MDLRKLALLTTLLSSAGACVARQDPENDYDEDSNGTQSTQIPEPCRQNYDYEDVVFESEPNDSPETASDQCTLVDRRREGEEPSPGHLSGGGFIGGDDLVDYWVFRTIDAEEDRDVYVWIEWLWDGDPNWFDTTFYRVDDGDRLVREGGSGFYYLERDQRYLIRFRVAEGQEPPETEYHCDVCWDFVEGADADWRYF